MIVRFVKLSVKEDGRELFKNIYINRNPVKLEVLGCKGVDAFEEVSGNGIFFTKSCWVDELAIEKYRNSEQFKATWAMLKPLFASKAEAWSTEVIV